MCHLQSREGHYSVVGACRANESWYLDCWMCICIKPVAKNGDNVESKSARCDCRACSVCTAWVKRIPKLSNSPAPHQLLLPMNLSPTASASICAVSVGREGVNEWLISPCCCFFWLRNRALTSKYYSLTPVYSQYKFSCLVCELSDWSTKKASKLKTLSLSLSLSPTLLLTFSFCGKHTHKHTHTRSCPVPHRNSVCFL